VMGLQCVRTSYLRLVFNASLFLFHNSLPCSERLGSSFFRCCVRPSVLTEIVRHSEISSAFLATLREIKETRNRFLGISLH
jgi:hypothetical protein